MANNLNVLDAASATKIVATTEQAVTLVHTPHQLVQPLAVTLAQTNPVIALTNTQVVAAKSDRKFLLIQNNDAANPVYLNFAGAAATTAGVKLVAGGSYQMDSSIGDQEIRGIATGAPVTLVVVEG